MNNSYLDEYMGKISGVYKERDALSANFIPSELPHRTEELKTVIQWLSFALTGSTPPNILILGAPGTGKTVSIKKALREINSYDASRNITTIYVVVGKTQQQTLIFMSQEVGLALPYRGYGFDELWKMFITALDRDKKVIIVLDEIDKILPHGSGLLYYLTREMNFCTIGVSNKINVLEMIDDKRVLSSFNPRKLVFKRYDALQLRDILEYRTSKAFYDGVIADGVLEYISAIAARDGGDARYALDLLMFSGDLVVRDGCSKVTVDIVKRAREEVEIEYVKRSICDMTVPQKILLGTIAVYDKHKKGGISPGDLYKVCKRVMDDYYSKSLTSRRLSEYLKELELLGFVKTIKRGKGRGKGFSWLVELNVDVGSDLILEVLGETLDDELPVKIDKFVNFL